MENVITNNFITENLIIKNAITENTITKNAIIENLIAVKSIRQGELRYEKENNAVIDMYDFVCNDLSSYSKC